MTFDPMHPAAEPALTWLDVGPDGRIMSRDPAIAHLIAGPVERGEVFALSPEAAYRHALDAANCAVDPRPTVLHPAGAKAACVRQVNVLPLEPGRIRLVFFVDCPDPARCSEPCPKLTPRETSVLNLLAAGLRRDRIAFELNISMPTVDMHARNLRQKLEALTTPEAVACAARLGLIRL
ncbi:helix-turn-helix transcriptional regulator [Thioclava sp. BHET1]|nr:helix-turn-helix transcriptional regulator [Thioclava sp. BHET1]